MSVMSLARAVLLAGIALASCGAQVRPETSARTRLDDGAALTKASVDAVIQAHAAGIAGCYERFAKAEGRPMGVVRLGWTVEPSGAVADVQVVSTTLRSTSIEGCMRDEVSRWTFPRAAERSVVAEHPFTF
ncbi:MAG: Glycine-rich cell wall structural protein 1 precursor [Labilithrix sp.]|nr:Glycine-rich cell wall structural protein 1 precursor [Labilithrix sp.]